MRFRSSLRSDSHARNRRSSAARRVYNIDHARQNRLPMFVGNRYRLPHAPPTVNPPTRCTTDGTKLLPCWRSPLSLAQAAGALPACTPARCQHQWSHRGTMPLQRTSLPLGAGQASLFSRRINPGRLTKSKGGERLAIASMPMRLVRS